MRSALLLAMLMACSSPPPGSVPNDACRTVLGGGGKCYTLAYTLDTASSPGCPAIDPYLGAMGEVDYSSYKSPDSACKTSWTDQCVVTDDCTRTDGTRNEATLAFNVDMSGMTAVVKSTKGSTVCTYHAMAGPLHTCK
jgi:hypothetical protein